MNQLLEEAVSLARQGKSAGLEQIYILTYKQVYRYAYHRSKEEAKSWALVREVYLELYQNIQNIPNAESILPVMFKKIDEKLNIKDQKDIKAGNEEQTLNISEDKATDVFVDIEETLEGLKFESKELTPLDKKIRIVVAMTTAVLALLVICFGLGLINGAWDTKKSDILESETIVVGEPEPIVSGWFDTDEGRRYAGPDLRFLTNCWKEEAQNLYYLDADGFMVTGKYTIGKQEFVFAEDGKLVDIKREDRYHISTENSMQKAGRMLYYMVKETKQNAPGRLRYRLYRIPSGGKSDGLREVVVQCLDDYLVYGDTIYYVLDRELHQTPVTKIYPKEEMEEFVTATTDGYQLLDELGQIITDSKLETRQIDDRLYNMQGGEVVSMKAIDPVINGITYFFQDNDGTKSKDIYQKDEAGKARVFDSRGFSIDAFCAVDSWIYYSAFIDKDGGQFSRIYRTSLDGRKREKVGRSFRGRMQNMYYFKEEGTIYAEYSKTGNQSTQIACMTPGGEIFVLDDSEKRTGETIQGVDRLELIDVKDNNVYCYWQDCKWDQKGEPEILWSKSITLSNTQKKSINQ